MDEARYQELIKKRDGVGLSDEEADELGALLAEKSGQAYGGSGERLASRARAETAYEVHLRERATGADELIEEERYEDTVNEEGFPP